MHRTVLLIALCVLPFHVACTPPGPDLPGDRQLTALSQDEALTLCDWAINDFFGGTCSRHPCPSKPDTYAKFVSTVDDCLDVIAALGAAQCNVTVKGFDRCTRAQQRDLCKDEYDECEFFCGVPGFPMSGPGSPFFSVAISVDPEGDFTE